MLTTSEQIHALLSGTAHALVMKTLGKSQLDSGDYSKLITVSHDEIIEFLIANCRVTDIAAQTESQADGYYALPSGGRWVVYVQERACPLHRNVVRSEQDVFAHFATHVLGVKK